MSTNKKLLVVHLSRDGLKSLKELAKICVDSDFLHVLLNFEKVNYLGGGEIGVLIDFQTSLDKYGGGVVLFQAGKEVQTMVRIMELEKSLNIVSSREDALNFLSPGGPPSQLLEGTLENGSQLDELRNALFSGGSEQVSATPPPPSIPLPPKGEFALKVEKRPLAGVGTMSCLLCAGDLNMMNVFSMEAQIQEVLQDTPPLLVFDFRHLNYINSSGMGTLVKAVDKVKKKNGSIALVNLPEKIEGLFRMLGLLATLNVFTTYDEVVKFISEEHGVTTPAPVAGSEPTPEPTPEPVSEPVSEPTPEPAPSVKPARAPQKPKGFKKTVRKIKEVAGLKLNKQGTETLIGENSMLVLSAVGAIDTLTCRYFEQQILDYIEEGFQFIAVDLRKVEYINSTGLGTLVKLHDQLESRGGVMGLVELSVKIYDLFDMLGISQVVYIQKDLARCRAFFLEEIRKNQPETKADEEPPAPAQPPEMEEKKEEASVPSDEPTSQDIPSFFVDSGEQQLGNLTVDWSTQRIGGRSILRVNLQGSIDTLSVGRLEKLLLEFIDAQALLMLYDFGGIDYLNSTGMGLLVKISDLIRTSGGEVATIHTSMKVKNLLDMLGISFALNLCNSEDEAYETLLGESAGSSSEPTDSASPEEVHSQDQLEVSGDLVYQEPVTVPVRHIPSANVLSAGAISEEPAESAVMGEMDFGEVPSGTDDGGSGEDSEDSVVMGEMDFEEVPSGTDNGGSGEDSEGSAEDSESAVMGEMDFGEVPSEEESAQVGDSELNMESELIQLIQESEKLEKQGRYQEAVEILEQAMQKAGYTDALMNRIEKLKAKIVVIDEVGDDSLDSLLQEEASEVANLLEDEDRASQTGDVIEAAIAGAATEEMSREDIDAALSELAKDEQPSLEEPEESTTLSESPAIPHPSEDETVLGSSFDLSPGNTEDETILEAPGLEKLSSNIDQDLEELSKASAATEDISYDAVNKNLDEQSAAPPNELSELIDSPSAVEEDLGDLTGEDDQSAPTKGGFDLDELTGGEGTPAPPSKDIIPGAVSGMATEAIDFNSIKENTPPAGADGGFDLDELTGSEQSTPAEASGGFDLDELTGGEQSAPDPASGGFDLDELTGGDEQSAPAPASGGFDLDELTGGGEQSTPDPASDGFDLDELTGSESSAVPPPSKEVIPGAVSGMATEAIDFNSIKESSSPPVEEAHLPGLASSTDMANMAQGDQDDYTQALPGVDRPELPNLEPAPEEQDHTQHLASLQATFSGIGEQKTGGGLGKAFILLILVVILGLVAGVGAFMASTSMVEVTSDKTVEQEKIEKTKKLHKSLSDLYRVGFELDSKK